MKNKILIAMAAILVFALAAVVYAYNLNRTENVSAKSSHCEMMKQQHHASSTENHKDSCCGMADCCKDGKCSMGGDCCKKADSCCAKKDSCPMKKNASESVAETETSSIDMTNVVVVGDNTGEDCCQTGADCCTKGSGSCCHKKKS